MKQRKEDILTTIGSLFIIFFFLILFIPFFQSLSDLGCQDENARIEELTTSLQTCLNELNNTSDCQPELINITNECQENIVNNNNSAPVIFIIQYVVLIVFNVFISISLFFSIFFEFSIFEIKFSFGEKIDEFIEEHERWWQIIKLVIFALTLISLILFIIIFFSLF